MSFWESIKRSTAAERLLEERLYERVLRELELGQRRDGLWLKAVENSLGDAARTQALYVRYRVQSLKDEAHLPVEPRPVLTKAAITYSPIDTPDSEGRTPLMNAVLAASLEDVQSLLARGANPAIKDAKFGTSTALDIAHLAYRRAASPEERSALQQIGAALGGQVGDI